MKMNAIVDQVLSILQSFFALFHELILSPLQKLLVHPSQRKDEIKININIDVELSSQKQKTRKVQFGGLEIRTYETILGDNPSCSNGPPLSIGWKYDPNKIINLPVDRFENHPSRKDQPRLKEFELLMDRSEREQLLVDLGYTQSEIVSAMRRILRDKKKRRQTTDNLSVAGMEEKIEGFKKSVQRNLHLKKGTKELYKKCKKAGSTDRMESSASSWKRAESDPCCLEKEDRGESASTGILSLSSEDTTASDDDDDESITTFLHLHESRRDLSVQMSKRLIEHRRASM